MWYYHDDERWYAIADPRQAPPGTRVWRSDEVTIAAGQARAGREERADDDA